jgi:transposase-like protein
MSIKGQKLTKYTKELKLHVILEKEEKGVSYSELAKRYQIPEGTVITWVYQYRKNKGLNVRPQGRPRTDETDYKERYEILKKFRDFLEVVDRKKK